MTSWEWNDLWERGMDNPVERPLGLQTRNVYSPPPSTLLCSLVFAILTLEFGR